MAAKISNPKLQKFVQSKEEAPEHGWVMFNLIRGGLINKYDKKTPTRHA